MESKEKKSGVQLPTWLHKLFPRAAITAGKQVKTAYAEAAIDWLKKTMAEDSVVKALVEREALKDPAIRSGLAGLQMVDEKPPERKQRGKS